MPERGQKVGNPLISVLLAGSFSHTDNALYYDPSSLVTSGKLEPSTRRDIIYNTDGRIYTVTQYTCESDLSLVIIYNEVGRDETDVALAYNPPCHVSKLNICSWWLRTSWCQTCDRS